MKIKWVYIVMCEKNGYKNLLNPTTGYVYTNPEEAQRKCNEANKYYEAAKINAIAYYIRMPIAD